MTTYAKFHVQGATSRL